MAQCARVLLSIVHVLVFIDCLFVFIYSLVTRESSVKCFPQLIQNDGSTIPFVHSFSYLCDGIIYSTACVCILHLSMCLFINCGWKNNGIILLNLFTTLLTALTSAFGGTTFTFYSILWCNSLSHWAGSPSKSFNDSCNKAADKYDYFHSSNNMTAYIRRMDFQQFSIWSAVPLAIIAIVTYAIALLNTESPRSREPQVHYVVFPEENTPLLINQRDGQQREPLISGTGSDAVITGSTENENRPM